MTIPTKKVNFYNYYDKEKELRASEDNSLFPLCFIINVTNISHCTTALTTPIIVTLHDIERERVEPIQFELFVPISVMNATHCNNQPAVNLNDSTTQSSQPLIDKHCCDENAPEVQELMKYSSKISVRWNEIALHLNIPQHKISVIDINHPNSVEGKCLKMFNMWLQTAKSPCWCHFLRALCTEEVGLYNVAEEAKIHLKFNIENGPSSDAKMKVL